MEALEKSEGDGSRQEAAQMRCARSGLAHLLILNARAPIRPEHSKPPTLAARPADRLRLRRRLCNVACIACSAVS